MDIEKGFIGNVPSPTTSSQVYRLYTLQKYCCLSIVRNITKFKSFGVLPKDLIQELFTTMVTDSRNQLDENSITLFLSRDMEELNMSFCSKLTPAVAQQIVRYCPNIKRLIINSARGFNDSALQTFCSAYQNQLVALDISRCFGLTNSSSLLSLTNLQHLSLRALGSLCHKNLQTLFSTCTNLVAINLGAFGKSVTDSDLIVLANKCTNLQQINLSNCFGVGDEGLGEILKKCTNLQLLKLASCPSVSTASLKQIGLRCTDLRVLDVCLFPHLDSECVGMFSRCTNLRSLNMHGSGLQTADNFDKAVNLLARSCPKLEALNLDYLNITDESIQSLAQFSHELVHLGLAGCKLLTGQFFHNLAINCPLRELNLSRCVSIQDAQFKLFARSLGQMAQLEYLDLTEMKVSSESIRILAKNSPNMKNLTLFEVGALDDETLLSFASSFPNLVILDVQGCQKITSEAAQKLKTLKSRTSIYAFKLSNLVD